MIYIDLKGLIEEVFERSGISLNLSEISTNAGVHRKIISRAYNYPQEKLSSESAGKLIEYFFHIMRHLPKDLRPAETDSEIMRWVTSRLFVVYPDSEKYWSILPRTIEAQVKQGKECPELAWNYFDKVEKADSPNMSEPEYSAFEEGQLTGEPSDEDQRDARRLLVEELFQARKKSK